MSPLIKNNDDAWQQVSNVTYLKKLTKLNINIDDNRASISRLFIAALGEWIIYSLRQACRLVGRFEVIPLATSWKSRGRTCLVSPPPALALDESRVELGIQTARSFKIKRLMRPSRFRYVECEKGPIGRIHHPERRPPTQ